MTLPEIKEWSTTRFPRPKNYSSSNRGNSRPPQISQSSNSPFDKLPKPKTENRNFADQINRKIDLNNLIQANKLPDDRQLQQLFHQSELEYFQADTPLKQQVALNKIQQMKETLAAIMTGPNALRNRDGYIIICNQAYGKSEAYFKALKDLEHFKQHGKHMPPLPYPSIPPSQVPMNQHEKIYPDITEQFNQELYRIEQEIKATPVNERFSKFKKNFRNNGNWDIQVNHGLPGQVPVLDSHGKPIHDNRGYIKTKDQYARYNNKVIRAGYLSNYAYGYGSTAAGFSKAAAITFAQGVAVLGGQDGDNPADIQAIKEGWVYYRAKHSK